MDGVRGQVAGERLAALLPGAVACEESDEPGDVETLFPEEAALVARAVDKRRREFAAVRGCARRALVHLGHPPVPLLTGDRGAPRWPSGVVGSLTHCSGYAAAAVAPAQAVLGLGIDAEPHAPLPHGVLEAVTSPAERAAVTDLLAARPDVRWDSLLFSAKESVYKCWFPLARRWLGFGDVALDVDPAGGTFAARLLVPGPTVAGRELTRFDGRWAVSSGLVLTAIALPH